MLFCDRDKKLPGVKIECTACLEKGIRYGFCSKCECEWKSKGYVACESE